MKSFAAAGKRRPRICDGLSGRGDRPSTIGMSNEVGSKDGPGRRCARERRPRRKNRSPILRSPRERAFMSAWKSSTSGKTIETRTQRAICRGNGAIGGRPSKDDEAQLFYALTLLGSSKGVRDTPTYLKATEISKKECSKGTRSVPAPPATGFMNATIRDTPTARWKRRRCVVPRSAGHTATH